MKKNISLVLSLLMLASSFFCVDFSALAADENVENRAQWLNALVETFDMTVEEDNYPDNYFSDINDDSEYYRNIMVAAEFGLVDVEAGDPVYPEGEITREFAAQTLNFCLGFELENTAQSDDENASEVESETDYEYTFSDWESCIYPDDDQVAVNRGWFELDENGNFCPDQVVTSTEISFMLDDATQVLKNDEVDDNYDSTYELNENVIEVPKDTAIEINDFTKNVNGNSVSAIDSDTNYVSNVVIYDTNINISKGDKFVVYSNDIPVTYEAKNVTVKEDCVVIETEDAPVEEVLEDIDMQEVIDVDTDDFIPAEGYEVVEEEPSFFARIFDVNDKISGKIKLKTKLDLSSGFSVDVEFEISNISFQIKENANNNSVTIKNAFDLKIKTEGQFNLKDLSDSALDKLSNLGSIPIAGIGFIQFKPDFNINGKVAYEQSYNITVGVTADSDGLHNISSFKKQSFDLVFELSGKIGIKASIGVKILVVKADLYAEIGVKAKATSEISKASNGSTTNCLTLSAYMYFNVGAEAEIKFLFFSKEYKYEVEIFDENNSPVRLYFHFENAQRVNACTVGSKTATKYLTPSDSKYGSIYTDNIENNFSIVSVDDFELLVRSNGTAIISDYFGSATTLNIPEYINGYRILKIGDSAFLNCDSLTSVTIPDSVTSIGYRAFLNCDSLTNITIPDSVTSIGDYAFWGCDSLTTITIPDRVTRIGDWAFSYCDSLTNITIPDRVTSIGDWAFSYCDSLTNITIPDSVTSIGDWEFSYCSSLTNVTIPDSVTNISNSAFNGCYNLSIVFYNGTEDQWNEISIESGNDNLINATIIYNPIAGHKHSFVIVDTVEATCTEDGYTLYGCDCGETYTIDVEKLGHDYTCTIIEPTCTEHGYKEYTCTRCGDTYQSDWVNPTGHNFVDGVCTYCGIKEIEQDFTFTLLYDGTAEITRYVGSDTEIVIPDEIAGHTVTSIGFQAFQEIVDITSVTIPNSVTNIGDNAFAYCFSLTDLIISENVTCIGEMAFYDCYGLSNVFYNGTEDQWNEISIESGNDNLINATIICNSTDGHEHSFVIVDTVEATCTKDGYNLYQCECGGSYEEVLKKTGHKFVNEVCANCGLAVIDIQISETKEIVINKPGEDVYFKFIPEESGKYKFYSTGDYDTYGSVNNENFEELNSNDDYADANFSVEFDVEAGKTYYLAARFYSSDQTGDFNVCLEKGCNHKYVETVIPPTCTEDGYTEYTCSICGDTYTADWLEALGHNFVDGVCTNCGLVINEINVDEKMKITVEEAGQYSYIKFVPDEDGVYLFSSTGDYDTCCTLYDESMSEIIYDDESGEGSNFLLSYELKAGKEYYYYCGMFDLNETGEFYVTLIASPINSVVYTPAQPYVIYQYANGYFEDSDNSSFYYYSVELNEGDKITVNYKDGTNDIFTYGNNGNYGFVNNEGNQLEVSCYDIGTFEGIGETSFEVEINNYCVTIDVPVTIAECPIESAEFTPVKPYEIYQNTNGYHDGNLYYYYSPNCCKGDEIVVNFKDGASEIYTYTDNGFISHSGEILDVSYESVGYFEGVGETTFNVNLCDYGFNIDVPVTITETPVNSIDYEPVNGFVNREGVTWGSADGEPYTTEDGYIESGDKLILDYKDIGKKEYYAKFNDLGFYEFITEDGEKLENSADFRIDLDYGDNWPISESVTISCYGCEKSFPVTSSVNISSISFKPLNPVIIVESDGTESDRNTWQTNDESVQYGLGVYWGDDENGETTVESEIFEIGDVLTVTFDDGLVKDYTYFANRSYEYGYYFIADDGTKLMVGDIRSNQDDHPWTVDSENYFTINFSQTQTERIPVTIVKAVDNDALNAAIEMFDSLNSVDYSSQSYSNLSNVVEEYRTVLVTAQSQKEVDDAVTAILEAMYDLVPNLNLNVSAENGSYEVQYDSTTSTDSKYSLLFGTEVTLTATANDGYKFVGWYDETSGVYLSKESTYTFNLTANMNIKAVFVEEKSATLTFTTYSNWVKEEITKTSDEWNKITSIENMLPEVPYRYGYSNGRWVYDNDKVLAKLRAGENVSIVAEYDEDDESLPTPPTPDRDVPVLDLYYKLDADENIGSFVMAMGIPENCKIESVGVAFYYKNANQFNPENFELLLNNKMLTSTFDIDENNIYIANVEKFTSKNNWAARGYVTYYDSDGNLKTVYSNQINIVGREQV